MQNRPRIDHEMCEEEMAVCPRCGQWYPSGTPTCLADGSALLAPDNMVRFFGPEDLSSKINTVVEIVSCSTCGRRHAFGHPRCVAPDSDPPDDSIDGDPSAPSDPHSLPTRRVKWLATTAPGAFFEAPTRPHETHIEPVTKLRSWRSTDRE